MTPRACGLRVVRTDAILHRDEGGQISALGVMAAAAFACLLLLVVNTGYATSGKIEMQNAADATAISGATWVARGLNVISMNNVTQTQILAIVLVVRALDRALPQAITTLEVQLGLCEALLVGAPACLAIITIQIEGLNLMLATVQAAAPLVAQEGALWTSMTALEKVSDGVKTTFVVVAEVEADRIARQDGADLGFIVPARLRVTLPVRKGAMRPDLCDPTRRGSPAPSSRGYHQLLKYDLNEGPFERYSAKLGYAFIPFENSLIRWYFWAARESHFRSLCGGAGGTSTAPPHRPMKSLLQCQLAGGGTATWAVIMYETVWFDSPQPGIALRKDDPRLAGPPRAVDPPQQRSCNWTPPGSPTGGGKYRSVKPIVETVGTDANGNPIRKYRYEFTDYVFLSATSPDRSPAPPAALPLPSGSSSPSDPDPYLLDDDAEADLRYLAVVYRSHENQVAPKHFVSPFGRHRLAYAQAQVYNPTAFDTFTQNWRVRLQPASLIEDGTLLGALAGPALPFSKIRDGGALERFRESAGLFNELRNNLNVLRYLNNH